MAYMMRNEVDFEVDLGSHGASYDVLPMASRYRSFTRCRAPSGVQVH